MDQYLIVVVGLSFGSPVDPIESSLTNLGIGLKGFVLGESDMWEWVFGWS